MVRTLRRAALSLPLLAALSFFLPEAIAQKPLPRDFLMQLEGMSTRDQEKTVRGALNDQDPLAVVSMDVPGQQVKIRTAVVLDRPLLDVALGAQGITIISLGPINTSDQYSERVAAAGILPGFPVHHDTGDPIHDGAVYQAEKAAWIAAHPDLYPPAGTPAAPTPR